MLDNNLTLNRDFTPTPLALPYAKIPEQVIRRHHYQRRDGIGDRHCSLVILQVPVISYPVKWNSPEPLIKSFIKLLQTLTLLLLYLLGYSVPDLYLPCRICMFHLF